MRLHARTAAVLLTTVTLAATATLATTAATANGTTANNAVTATVLGAEASIEWVQASPDRHQAILADIDSRSGSTWAVGSDLVVDFADQRPLALRRQNDKWVVTPQPMRTNSSLNSVAVGSATDVWAVGDDFSDPAAAKPLVMHWDGRAWTVVPGPAVATGSFSAVEIGPDGAVWAAGWANVGGTERAAVYRYAGGRWKSLNAGLADALNANTLVVVSANDAWVGLNSGSVLAHFTGARWTAAKGVPLDGVPTGFAATGPDDIWMAGIDHGADVPIGASLLMHYDGSAWTRVAAPGGSTQLYDITVRNGRPVAVGESFDAGFHSRQLVLRYNGARFVEVAAPTGAEGTLTGVTAAGTRLWTVGLVLPTATTFDPYAARTS